jgi:hypothetical protein
MCSRRQRRNFLLFGRWLRAAGCWLLAAGRARGLGVSRPGGASVSVITDDLGCQPRRHSLIDRYRLRLRFCASTPQKRETLVARGRGAAPRLTACFSDLYALRSVSPCPASDICSRHCSRPRPRAAVNKAETLSMRSCSWRGLALAQQPPRSCGSAFA